MGLAPATISGVVAGAQIAGMVTALLSGAITARLGSKWVLVCGLALAGLSSLAFQVPAFWWVTFLWLIGGAGASLVSIGGASYPTLMAYAAIVVSGLGLSVSVGSVVGTFAFGVLGIAAAWALATLMYVWVADGVPKTEHAATFGMLHAVWSLSMIAGSVFGGWFVQSNPGLPFLLIGLLNVTSLFLTVAYYRKPGL